MVDTSSLHLDACLPSHPIVLLLFVYSENLDPMMFLGSTLFVHFGL